jgi:hypothetical protein
LCVVTFVLLFAPPNDSSATAKLMEVCHEGRGRAASDVTPRGKQKQSKYDYVAARESIGLPGANSQQITSASMATDDNQTPSIRSPPKKVVKVMLQQA